MSSLKSVEFEKPPNCRAYAWIKREIPATAHTVAMVSGFFQCKIPAEECELYYGKPFRVHDRDSLDIAGSKTPAAITNLVKQYCPYKDEE